MTAPDNPHRDSPRDARLLAALRHAPDHDLAPPSALSAQILAQARRAAGASPSRPAIGVAGFIERWFGWMSRPVAAGAFGTVLIAGFVGLMWRGGPPPEAFPGSEPTAVADRAQAPAPATAAVAPQPAQATPPAAAAMEPRAKAADVHRAPTPATTNPAPPTPMPRQAVPAQVPAPPPPVLATGAAPIPAAAPAVPATAGGATTPSEPSPAIPASPAPLAAPQPAAPAAKAPPAQLGAPAAAAPRAAVAAAEPTAEMARNGRALGNAPAAARVAAPALDPLAPALAALTPAADPAWRERLLGLQRLAQGRWVSVDEATVGAALAERPEAVVDASGRLLGHLRTDGRLLVWQGADGRTWRAMLPAAAVPAERAASD